MTDIVERLRRKTIPTGFKDGVDEDTGHHFLEIVNTPDPDCMEAAARIEELKAKLAKAVEALQIIASHPNSDELYNDAAFDVEDHACDFDEYIFLARTTLAAVAEPHKLKGETK